MRNESTKSASEASGAAKPAPGAEGGKVAVVLAAAFDAFARYGFRRTSMQDIAQGAGMSRAALYLLFRNKDDIYRRLVQSYYDAAAEAVAAVLALGLPAPDAMARAVKAQAGPAMEALLSSPHGEELLDAKSATAAPVVQAGEARLGALYGGWLRREAGAGRIALEGEDPELIAATFLAALHGLKHDGPDYATYCTRATLLARRIGRGLLP